MLMTRLGNRSLSRLRADERGQGLVEYALIIALVGLASIVALGFLSTKINTLFSKAGNSLNNVPVAAGSTTGGTTGPPGPTAPVNTAAPSVTCSNSPCEDDNNLSTTNGTWTDGGAPPLAPYSYQWRMANDGNGDSCPAAGDLAYSNVGSNQNTHNPQDFNDDRCYYVIVTATNAVPLSASANSNVIYVDQD
jgi:pilus assembly protein Flp/PilA